MLVLNKELITSMRLNNYLQTSKLPSVYRQSYSFTYWYLLKNLTKHLPKKCITFSGVPNFSFIPGRIPSRMSPKLLSRALGWPLPRRLYTSKATVQLLLRIGFALFFPLSETGDVGNEPSDLSVSSGLTSWLWHFSDEGEATLEKTLLSSSLKPKLLLLYLTISLQVFSLMSPLLSSSFIFSVLILISSLEL